LQREIREVKQELEELERAMHSAVAAFGDLDTKTSNLVSAQKRLADATQQAYREQHNLLRALNDLTSETRKLETAVDKTSSQLRTLGDSAQSTSNDINSLTRQTDLATVSLRTQGDEARDAASETKHLENAIKEAAKAESKLGTAAGKANSKIEEQGNKSSVAAREKRKLGDAAIDAGIGEEELSRAAKDAATSLSKSGSEARRASIAMRSYAASTLSATSASRSLASATTSAAGAHTTAAGAVGAHALSLHKLTEAVDFLDDVGEVAGPIITFMWEALAKASETSMEFDEALSSLADHANLSASQTALLKTQIEELSHASTFSATDIAKSFDLLAQRQNSLTDALNKGLGQAIINLAAATNTELEPATELMNTALETFGLNAQNATDIADMFYLANRNGVRDITDLNDSMESLGGYVKTLHISFNGYLGTISALASSGIPNLSTATDVLSGFLKSLVAPSDKAVKALSDLGLIEVNTAVDGVEELNNKIESLGGSKVHIENTATSLLALYDTAEKMGALDSDKSFFEWAESIGALDSKFFDLNGNLKPLPELIRLVGDSMKGLPDADKISKLSQIFGVDTSQAAQLANMDPSKALNLSNQMGQQKDGVQSQAVVKAAQDWEHLHNVLQRTKGELSNVLAIMGTPINAALTPLLTVFNNMLVSLQRLSPEARTFIGTFLTVAAVLTPLLLIVGIMAVMLSLMGPWVPLFAGVAAGIALVATGAGLFAAHWGALAPVLQKTVAALKPFAPALAFAGVAIAGFLPFAGGLTKAIAASKWTSLSGMAEGLARVAGSLTRIVAHPISSITSLATGIGKLASSGWAGIDKGMALLATGIERLAIQAVTAVPSVIAFGVPFLAIAAVIAILALGFFVLWQRLGGLQGVIKTFKPLWDGIVSSFQNVLKVVQQLWQQGIQQLQQRFQQLQTSLNSVKPAIAGVATVLGAILTVIISVGGGIIHGLIGAIAPAFALIMNLVNSVFQVFTGMIQFFMGIWSIIQGIFTGNSELIQAGWELLWTGVQNIVMGIWNGLVSWFTGLAGIVLGIISGFIKGFIDFFTQLWMKLVGNSIVPDVVRAIIKWISDMPGQVLGKIGAFVSQMIGKFGEMANQAKGKAGELVNNVTSTIQGLGSKLLEAGQNAIHMFADGIRNAAGAVTDAISNVAGKVKEFLGFNSPPKGGPLSNSDTYMPIMMSMYARGIQDHKPMLLSAVEDVVTGMHTTFTSPKLTHMGYQNAFEARFGNMNFNLSVNLDGKQIAGAVATQVVAPIRLNGLHRAWR
jgi:phage-related protein